jgi:hypothetical protein
MDSGSDSSLALVGLLLVLQLFLLLVFVIGGIYVLYCLNKAASGLDRLASVAEAWLEHETRPKAGPGPVPFVPGQPSAPETPAPVVPPAAVTPPPVPSTPAVPSPAPEAP